MDPENTSIGSVRSDDELGSAVQSDGERSEDSRISTRPATPNKRSTAGTSAVDRREAEALAETRRLQQEMEFISRRIDATHRLVARASLPRNTYSRAETIPVRANLGRSFDHIGRQRRTQWPVRQPPVLPVRPVRGFPAGLDRRPQAPQTGHPDVGQPLPVGFEIQPSRHENPADRTLYRGSLGTTGEASNRTGNSDILTAAAGTGITLGKGAPAVIKPPGFGLGLKGAVALALAIPAVVAAITTAITAASIGPAGGDAVDETHDLGDGSTARVTGNGDQWDRSIIVSGGDKPETSLTATLLSTTSENEHVLEITGGTADGGNLHPMELLRIVRRLSTANGLIVSLSEEVKKEPEKDHIDGLPIKQDKGTEEEQDMQEGDDREDGLKEINGETDAEIGKDKEKKEKLDPPKLKRLHSDETLSTGSNKYGLEDQRKRSTDDIIESLKPDAREPLTVKPDGTIMDGNTRIKVLEERGVDVDKLPRVYWR